MVSLTQDSAKVHRKWIYHDPSVSDDSDPTVAMTMITVIGRERRSAMSPQVHEVHDVHERGTWTFEVDGTVSRQVHV
jgi:hypothetical protein